MSAKAFAPFAVSLRFTLLTLLVLGILYPFAMAGIARVLFPAQAAGSLVRVDGAVVGSDLIGEAWTGARWFWGRPSAAGKNGYDPTATGGTNLGPTSRKLIDATRATIASLRKSDPDATTDPPMDLVTSSGSGIDPDISPEAAYYEAPRIAKARGVPVSTIDALIARTVRGRFLGFVGEPRVNVLELNLALRAASRS